MGCLGFFACASADPADDALTGGIGSLGQQTGEANTSTTLPAADSSDDGDVTAPASTDSGGDTGDPCLFCDSVEDLCLGGECVPRCSGVSPDPCGPAQVCDVITGQCHDPAQACTLAGETTACGDMRCGPGSICDGAGACIPYAPCAGVVCRDDGSCWGQACSCERPSDCVPPTAEALNGPFSHMVSDLAFADDCTAWMVTITGWDFVRRLTPDGMLTEWPGVSNLNMGEIEVLKALSPAGITAAGEPPTTLKGPPPAAIEGIGDVALTYICCASCNCASNPKQGLARLDEGNPDGELPLVIEATPSVGQGPFGAFWTDTGPFGLAWGQDRVLYIGNAAANGTLHTADLLTNTQSQIYKFPARVHAATSISAVHLMVALAGGELHRFNTKTLASELVLVLDADITSLAFDPLTARVFASLRTFDVMEVDPMTGASSVFSTMPGRGRVAISPDGQLWYSPMYFLFAVASQPVPPIMAWPLPQGF